MKALIIKVGDMTDHYIQKCIQRNGVIASVLLSDIFPNTEIDAKSYLFEMLSAYKRELAMCGVDVESRRRDDDSVCTYILLLLLLLHTYCLYICTYSKTVTVPSISYIILAM